MKIAENLHCRIIQYVQNRRHVNHFRAYGDGDFDELVSLMRISSWQNRLTGKLEVMKAL